MSFYTIMNNLDTWALDTSVFDVITIASLLLTVTALVWRGTDGVQKIMLFLISGSIVITALAVIGFITCVKWVCQ